MEFHSEKDLEQEQPNCQPQEDEEEELCDSSFIVEGIDMNAHKAVLAACSAYFRAIFLHQKDMARKNTSKTTGWLLCVHFTRHECSGVVIITTKWMLLKNPCCTVVPVRYKQKYILLNFDYDFYL